MTDKAVIDTIVRNAIILNESFGYELSISDCVEIGEKLYYQEHELRNKGFENYVVTNEKLQDIFFKIIDRFKNEDYSIQIDMETFKSKTGVLIKIVKIIQTFNVNGQKYVEIYLLKENN